jgi:hypothetical protein
MLSPRAKKQVRAEGGFAEAVYAFTIVKLLLHPGPNDKHEIVP